MDSGASWPLLSIDQCSIKKILYELFDMCFYNAWYIIKCLAGVDSGVSWPLLSIDQYSIKKTL